MLESIKNTGPGLYDALIETEEKIIALTTGKTSANYPDFNELSDNQKQEKLEELRAHQKELHALMADKIDDTYMYRKFTQGKIKVLAEEIALLQAKKKALQNSLDGYSKYMAERLDAQDVPAIEGRIYKMSLHEKNTVVPKALELTSAMYLELNRGKNVGIINREYTWNKSAFQAEYKKNPEQLEKYAEQKSTKYIRFGRA